MPFRLTGLLVAALCLGLATQAVADDAVVRKAPAGPAEVVDRCAKIEPLPGTPVVPSGSIFGFTDPTDLGDPCTWNIASENTGRAGRRDGSYFGLDSKSEISYTYNSNIAFAFAAFTAYTRWSNVTVARTRLPARATAFSLIVSTGSASMDFRANFSFGWSHVGPTNLSP